MLSKTRIGAIVYYVSNLDRTEAFYRDVIGLDVQRIPGEGEGGEGEGASDWLTASVDGGPDLLFFTAPCQPGNSPVIVFELADGGIDAAVAGLADKGVTIVTPVSHAPGGWSADFADPDGFTLSMYQSAEKPR